MLCACASLLAEFDFGSPVKLQHLSGLRKSRYSYVNISSLLKLSKIFSFLSSFQSK